MGRVASIILTTLLLCAGCGTIPVGTGGASILPVPIFLPVPITLAGASAVPLDGQWVLADDNGGRSCLTIQESRVSILNVTCSNNQSGFAARIINGPVIARTGDQINMSVTYNPNTFDTAEAILTFTGTLQNDGTFIGRRVDSRPDLDGLSIRVAASLSRASN